jgi:hypothetical protein
VRSQFHKFHLSSLGSQMTLLAGLLLPRPYATTRLLHGVGMQVPPMRALRAIKNQWTRACIVSSASAQAQGSPGSTEHDANKLDLAPITGE